MSILFLIGKLIYETIKREYFEVFGKKKSDLIWWYLFIYIQWIVLQVFLLSLWENETTTYVRFYKILTTRHPEVHMSNLIYLDIEPVKFLYKALKITNDTNFQILLF